MHEHEHKHVVVKSTRAESPDGQDFTIVVMACYCPWHDAPQYHVTHATRLQIPDVNVALEYASAAQLMDSMQVLSAFEKVLNWQDDTETAATYLDDEMGDKPE